MKVVIVKYNAGNIRSVDFALQRLGVQAEITDNPAKIKNASRVIFPGVGEASTTMKHLQKNGLDETITSLTQPVLGICLGLQLMCSWSEEGNTPCLGIFPNKVLRFNPAWNIKIPHMGWNRINNLKSELFVKPEKDPYAYFVHSFFAESGLNTIAHAEYGIEFSAALNHENFFAVQFHPEKSSLMGSWVLRNFLAL